MWWNQAHLEEVIMYIKPSLLYIASFPFTELPKCFHFSFQFVYGYPCYHPSYHIKLLFIFCVINIITTSFKTYFKISCPILYLSTIINISLFCDLNYVYSLQFLMFSGSSVHSCNFNQINYHTNMKLSVIT